METVRALEIVLSRLKLNPEAASTLRVHLMHEHRRFGDLRMPARRQKLVVVQRRADERYLAMVRGSSVPAWVEDIALANVFRPERVRSLIVIDLGRDMEDYQTHEVVPALKGD